MASGNYTVTTNDVHIPVILGVGVLKSRQFKMVMHDSINTNWQEFLGYGDVYSMSRLPNIETETKAASTDLVPFAYTDTKQDLTINTHQGTSLKMEDAAAALSKPDVMKGMTKTMGYSLARAVDVNLFTLPASFSQIVGSLGVSLTYDNLLTAMNYLLTAGISMDEDVCWIFHPDQWTQLFKIDEVRHSSFVGDKNAMGVQTEGKIGTLLGAPVKMSPLVRAPASGQHENMLMQRAAIAMMMVIKPKVETERFALSVATVAAASQLYGYTEVDVYSESPGNITATDENAVLLKGK